jgi:hypothetical protein
MVDEILTDIHSRTLQGYIDDIIAGSQRFSDHLLELQKLFDKLKEVGLHLKLAKCSWCKTQLNFLGHTISAKGIYPDPKKIEVVQKLTPPVDLKSLRRFLGLTSYYRKFIRHYAQVAHPLNSLLRKGTIYKWTDDCQVAFEELKHRLATAPILAYPDFTKPFALLTDASCTGLGAVLAQNIDGKEHVIAYCSRSLTKAEANYGITDLESLAAVWAISYFRPYLFGQRFTLYTDHQAVKALKSEKDLDGRLARWAIKLQPFQFDVQYKPGKTHTNEDALSRLYENTPVNSVNTIEANTFQQHQRADPDLLPLIEYLESDILPLNEELASQVRTNATLYTLVDGILCFTGPSGPQQIRKSPIRMALPFALRHDILLKYHNDPWSGHLSMKRTYARISSKYYWPQMYSDINDWIKTCADCATKKRYPILKLGTPHTFISTRPFQTLGADFMGPFPATHRGNRFIHRLYSIYISELCA